MFITAETIWSDLKLIREKKPLIHNITNYVVMNSTANGLLALGASPLMAHALEEIDEIVKISDALVLNIGTLDHSTIQSMHNAAQVAKQKKIPIILDPVGSGASKLRTMTCRDLMEKKFPSIIRGNSSEILSLIDDLTKTKGVDSTLESNAAICAGKILSKKYQMIVSISGEIDINIKDDEIVFIKNGHPLMTKVTGMGCLSTTYIAAFHSINPNALQSAAHAMAVMGIAGELAQIRSSGPGSFQAAFLDSIYNLNLDEIKKYLRVN